MKECPFEAWQLLQTKMIIQWLTEGNIMNPYLISFLERIENQLFDLAYEKLGLKPIGKCTIQELQEELKKRRVQL